MKTYPPEEEHHDTESGKDVVKESNIFKLHTFESNTCESCSSINNESEFTNGSESDNLIMCNPELASSFQTLKSEIHKINPGHYFQKVLLNSVAPKFRSQSLPDCFEKEKNQNNRPRPISGVVNDETSELLVSDIDIGFSIIDEKDPLSEGWFKTWPERGIDKVLNHNGVTIGARPTPSYTVCEQKNITSPGQPDVRLNELDPEYFQSARLNFARPSDKNPKLIQKFRVGLPRIYNDTKNVGAGKSCGPLSNSNSRHSANQIRPSPKSISLNELLDNFPLAYNPVTKQLLLIKSEGEQNKKSRSLNVDNDAARARNPYKTGEDILNLEEFDTEKLGGGRVLATNSRDSECDLFCSFPLQHINTEVSSFSSTVSSLSDNSPSTNEDSALGSLLDHGDTCSLVSVDGCSAFSEDSVGTKKKKSLAGFFSRSVFNWKSGSRSEDSLGRWKLFGKNTSPLSSLTSLTIDHYAESDRGSLAPDSPCSVRSSGSGARTLSHETRVASSSALIQMDRPANLPAKSSEEEARHRQEYQQIVEAAKKKELKDAKLRKKQQQLQLQAEEQLAQATRIWIKEILPQWDQMHMSKKAQELWWQGVPPCVRGKVWRHAIGNPLNLTHSLYNIYVQRAQDRLQGGGTISDQDQDNKEASMELIQLDISRTFPHLCIFQKGGPYYDMLHCLLAAYVCYRPDVGYVQGMSFIAAVLILNMEAADAFVCFANLLDRPCHMAFFHLNQPLMQAYYSTYNELFKENLPQLYDHFTQTTLSPDLYLLDWIYTVFTKAMNLDLACRVWDVFLRDGEQFLFRTALGVLHLCQDILLQMDFVRGSQFLTRLPDDLSADLLFKSISCIKMTVGKQTFKDILRLHAINCQ